MNDAACSKKSPWLLFPLSWSWSFISFHFIDYSVGLFSENESFTFTGAWCFSTCLLDRQDKTKGMNFQFAASIRNAFGGDLNPQMLHESDFLLKIDASSTENTTEN